MIVWASQNKKSDGEKEYVQCKHFPHNSKMKNNAKMVNITYV